MDEYCVGAAMAVDWGDDAEDSRIERGLISPTFDTLRPLIEATGMEVQLAEPVSDGVERSLIREQLRRSPAQRLGYATTAANALARMRRSAAGASA